MILDDVVDMSASNSHQIIKRWWYCGIGSCI